jgi:8-oxo-dGTP pyrophosphatase MutT (NUDIX family)
MSPFSDIDFFSKRFPEVVTEYGLKGMESHINMAPLPKRLIESPTDLTRKAGVLILVYPDQGQLKFPLIKRVSRNSRDPHSGQISLPGGRYETEDLCLLNTALRETHEEIGVSIKAEQVIGRLSDLYIPVSDNLVSPFVAITEDLAKFELDPNEVEEIFSVDLTFLIQAELRQRRRLNTSYATDFEVPGFDFHPHWIWGATAMILEEFSELVKKI